MAAVSFTDEKLEKWNKRPQPSGCRLMDWDKVEIVPGIVNGTYVAIVSGTKDSPATDVRLSLLTYVRQPEYWGIEVIGCMNGIDFVPGAPYTVATAADHLGTKGIEIIGANRHETFEVPPK
jgi:hypothetical protein